MTSHLVRAFDRTRDVRAVTLPCLPQRPRVQPGRRALSVKGALEWAFGVELVQLDFEDRGGGTVGCDSVLRLMRRHEVGCRIDGGGRSGAHHDAEVIASFVAALPRNLGGAAMAVQLADCARRLGEPDALVGEVPRCQPVDWQHANQFAPMGRAHVLETITTRQKGRKVKRDVMWVPVHFHPAPATIARARANWRAWWMALHHVGVELTRAGRLESIALTGAMPAPDPWAKKAD